MVREKRKPTTAGDASQDMGYLETWGLSKYMLQMLMS
jgi:hypothetical protein